MDYIYTYQTKNLINGKTYVGVHTTNRLNDGYIGCGIKSDASCRSQTKAVRNYPFINAIAKYGYKNFKKEILSFYENIEDAYSDEEYIVDEKWVLNKDNYNVSLGGKGSKKIYRLNNFKEEINTLFSDRNVSYKFISEKYNTTKGSWIGLITEESKIKRSNGIKHNKHNKGLKVENLNGYIVELIDLKSFKEETGLCSKGIFKIKTSGVYNGWYISGSTKLQSASSNRGSKCAMPGDKRARGTKK